MSLFVTKHTLLYLSTKAHGMATPPTIVTVSMTPWCGSMSYRFMKFAIWRVAAITWLMFSSKSHHICIRPVRYRTPAAKFWRLIFTFSVAITKIPIFRFLLGELHELIERHNVVF